MTCWYFICSTDTVDSADLYGPVIKTRSIFKQFEHVLPRSGWLH